MDEDDGSADDVLSKTGGVTHRRNLHVQAVEGTAAVAVAVGGSRDGKKRRAASDGLATAG